MDKTGLAEEERKRKKRERERRYYENNKERLRKQKRDSKRARFAADPDKMRDADLRSRYGITLDQYDALFEEQGFKCAVCDTPEPRGQRGWCVDHCHTTGAVRGVLCNHCNVMLGMSQDSPATLVKAADYLNRSTPCAMKT